MGRFSKRRGRGRYRQQKLAVATVQKIAREVAKQEDNKHIHWIIHRAEITRVPGWTQNFASPTESQKYVLQPNLPSAVLLSQIGNLTESQLTTPESGGTTQIDDRSNFYFVKAACAYMAFENNTAMPVRCRAELVFVPNLNSRTDDAIDNLDTDIETFKSGVNLKFKGIFRPLLRMQGTDSAGSPIYRLLASKEFVLPACKQYSTPAPPASGVGVAGYHAQVRKYVNLSKYWKRPLKLLWKSYVQQQEITGPQMCDNGNILVQVCTDTTTSVLPSEYGSQIGVKMWGTLGCKYFVRAGKKDTQATLS